MNKAILFALMIFVVSLPVFAQETATSPLSLGVNAEVGVPMGDWSDFYSIGLGGTVNVNYMVDPNFALTGRVGYLSFSGKDNAGYKPDASSIIPILVGAKYYFMPSGESMRVYGAAEVGLFMVKVSTPAVVFGGVTLLPAQSETATKFGFAPSLGAQFKAGDNMDVDVHVNYTTVSTEGSSRSWMGVGIGLVFGM